MNAAQPRRSRFFAWSAIIIAIVVLISFPLTYFGPLITGSKSFTLLRHLHGLAFFTWTAFYVAQTQLVLRGRVKLHRELGLAGIALAGAMLPLGLWLAVVAAEDRIRKKSALPFEFTLYNLVDIMVFSLFMAWAIFETRRRIEWHRRLAFVAVLNLMGPAASRLFIPLPMVFPWWDMGPNVVADLFLLGLAWHDRRALGRIHPATLIAAVVLIPFHIVEPFIARSDCWNAVAPALFGFG
jgi:hypothetical protein